MFNTNKRSLIFSSSSEPIVAVGDDSTQMQCIIFHLFNFKDILATSVNLNADDWIVEIKSLPESDSIFKKLEKEGGYGLTHVGCIKKRDNSLISGKEAMEINYALKYFFSFAKGDWCEPICPVGFDNSGKKVWKSWSAPTTSFSSLESWFDKHHCEQLENLFPCFIRCWFNENLNDTIQKAIYWYINAINSKIDVGIVLTQTVLEGMSFGYVVNVLKKKTADTFKRLSAAEKIKLLFDNLNLNIPVGIKENTPELKKVAEEFRWQDNALEAIILVRNSLVHPNKKYRGKFKSALYYDARNLGLWYFELSLIKLLGYTGTYSNRLTAKWVGEVEEVPWKK